MSDTRPASVLTLAGSDSGGGAGIQADLKTFAALGVHGVSVITALTAQNTRGVQAVHVPPLDFLAAQCDAVFDDFRVVAAKTGMLASAALIEAVVAQLRGRPGLAVVVDPVMIASTGAALLAPDAVVTLRRTLLPLASVLTPNLPEAEALLGRRITGADQMPSAAADLLALGPRAVLLKGGHLDADDLVDVYVDARGTAQFVHPRLLVEGHGTGCTLSAAIAANLARGLDPLDACRQGCDFVHGALRHATWPGRGRVAVLDHAWRGRD